MTNTKIEAMFQLAERIVAKCHVREPVVGLHHYDYERDMATVLTEGRLRGKLFATWMPVTQAALDDEAFRSRIMLTAQDTWRSQAMNALVPLNLLAGPKHKLPR